MRTPAVTLTLERGLQLLRAFRAERKPLTNAELVRRTGLSRSSVSRLTITLVNMGFLRRTSGDTELELALGGFDIGYAYTKANPVTQRVHPFMQDLANRLEATVALAVPDGLDMLYIACRTSAHIATLRLDVGSLLPMSSTAFGKAWLWAAPEHVRQIYMDAILKEAGPKADEIRQRFERAFEDLDASGVCMTVGEYQHNAYGIALPLRVGRSDTLLALNCGAVGLALDAKAIRERIRPVLREAAQEITELLRDVDATP
jgi:DNA-binding IclR family transcriptional regulator